MVPRRNNPIIKYANKASATVYNQDFILTSILFPNTKQENPKAYIANFMQYICTGYCESWTLSPSFLMSS